MSVAKQSMKRGESSDSTLTTVIVGFVLLFLVIFLVHRYTPVMYQGWKVVFLPVAKVISVVAGSFVGKVLNPMLHTTYPHAAGLVTFLQTTPVTQWSFNLFYAMNDFIGRYLMVVFFPIGIYITVVVFRMTYGYSESYKNFKNSKEINDYVLSDENKMAISQLNKEDWLESESSSAISFERFFTQYKLLKFEEDESDQFSLKQVAAKQIFINQLGKKYNSRQQLFDSSVGWVAKRLLSFIPLAQRSETLDKVLEGCGYDSTAILALLEGARKLGVVPLNQFLKLKKQNRHLWYALMSCGRKVAFVEGAGIIAQFNFEQQYKEQQGEKGVNYRLYGQVNMAVEGLMRVLLEEPFDVQQVKANNQANV